MPLVDIITFCARAHEREREGKKSFSATQNLIVSLFCNISVTLLLCSCDNHTIEHNEMSIFLNVEIYFDRIDVRYFIIYRSQCILFPIAALQRNF